MILLKCYSSLVSIKISFEDHSNIYLVSVSKTVNMGECNCDTRITKTIVLKENDDWRVEYSFDKVSDQLILHTDNPNDLSDIKFPPSKFCPYTY